MCVCIRVCACVCLCVSLSVLCLFFGFFFPLFCVDGRAKNVSLTTGASACACMEGQSRDVRRGVVNLAKLKRLSKKSQEWNASTNARKIWPPTLKEHRA